MNEKIKNAFMESLNTVFCVFTSLLIVIATLGFIFGGMFLTFYVAINFGFVLATIVGIFVFFLYVFGVNLVRQYDIF